MLTRRAKAYSSSCSQIVLVYLQPFHCIYFLKCAVQQKIAKKTMKPLIFGLQGLSKSSMLMQLKSSSLRLIGIGSISMSICNRFYGRLANNGEITTFMGYRSLMPSFLEHGRSRLGPLKSTFNAKNFCAACLGLSVPSECGAICSWNVSRGPKSPKNP